MCVCVQVLCSIRGVKVADKGINEEFADIQRAVDGSHKNEASVSYGLVSLLKNYPQILAASIVIPIAQQFTGMNAIMFVSACCQLGLLCAAAFRVRYCHGWPFPPRIMMHDCRTHTLEITIIRGQTRPEFPNPG